MSRGGWSSGARGQLWRAARRMMLALALALGAALTGAAPVAWAHALPIKTAPAANQILSSPPTQVRIWYDDSIVPAVAHIVVVSATNHEVDTRDARVTGPRNTELVVGLLPLDAGTYVVAWRVQSSDDGHITSGSFIFRVRRADGSVPPVPAHLPNGNSPTTSGTALDGPTIIQTLATWMTYVALAFWVGGVIWETWILPPDAPRDPDLAAAAAAASRRFRRLAMPALGLLLLADLAIVAAEAAEAAGAWGGALSPQILRAILFDSQFGRFWWLRQGAAAGAIALTLLVARRAHVVRAADGATPPVLAPAALGGASPGVPDWRRELALTLRRVPRLPWRLARGLRQARPTGWLACALAALLLVAFALSGHAAAVPPAELPYAVGVDLVHLLGNAAWVGGLLYISVVFVPALATLAPRTRARVLAAGMPEFSALAVVSAAVLALTGSLNTSIHLTSIGQFLATAYGRTLFVKIELFLIMVGMSAYHAFVVRPRLARALAQEGESGEHRAIGTVGGVLVGAGPAAAPPSALASSPALAAGPARPSRSRDDGEQLADHLADWLRREALVGVLVLLCVALLEAFEGTLAPSATSASSAPPQPPVALTQRTPATAPRTIATVSHTAGAPHVTLWVRVARGV